MKPEEDLIRIPAIQNFNGSDFSVQLPIPGVLTEALGDFHPDIIHSHHPFFIGDTALRMASKYNVPLVFTHHTLYEENVHYVPGNENALKRFAIELSSGYANLADQVFAPSESVMQLMRSRGVQSPIEVVPTGVYTERFAHGARSAFRKKFNIPYEAFVVGYLGRLAPEKNLEFLARAVAQFLRKHPKAHFLVGGKGPSEMSLRDILWEEGVVGRLHLTGPLKGRGPIDAYHAMDVFTFASQSETQGLVVTEAMAAGLPVIAVNAPGVREVVHDGINGRLLAHENIDDFVFALREIYQQSQSTGGLRHLNDACRRTAAHFAMGQSVDKALSIYVSLCVEGFVRRSTEESPWVKNLRLIHAQWGLIKNLTKAAKGAMIGLAHEKSQPDQSDAGLDTEHGAAVS
jgi:glycosyltransferase involved in cell wall biosynthesis